MHYISKKCWWFWDSTQKHANFKLRIFKIPITTGFFFLIQNIHEVTWWFKYWSCVFEYSWSDLMGILNIQKVPSWVILNIHEAKWCHWYFEYEVTLWNDVMELFRSSWVFWIFMNIQKWRRCKWTWVFWIFKSWFFEYLWGSLVNTKLGTSLVF